RLLPSERVLEQGRRDNADGRERVRFGLVGRDEAAAVPRKKAETSLGADQGKRERGGGVPDVPIGDEDEVLGLPRLCEQRDAGDRPALTPICRGCAGEGDLAHLSSPGVVSRRRHAVEVECARDGAAYSLKENRRGDAALTCQRNLLDELERLPPIGRETDHRLAASGVGPPIV